MVSFGGPAAHVGYFRKAFVQDRKWMDDRTFASTLALCQFLPGPASSQLGFAIGRHRGGFAGAWAAFLGFTLPSFLLMAGLAVATSRGEMPSWFDGVVTGLKWLAVVVVADAVLGMFRSFCQHRLTQALCVGTAAWMLLMPGLYGQFGALIAAALLGMRMLRPTPDQEPTTSSRELERASIRWVPLVLFGIVFALSCTVVLGMFGPFFRTGSLVFGGGHVVLPLLQSSVDGVSSDRFLLGYAAAQGIPGPMFTLASFLGAEIHSGHAWGGALIATLGIFLPGFLLVLALSDVWHRLSEIPNLAGAVAGLNAAVVGLLLAALYQPVFASAIHAPAHMAYVMIGFYVLRALRWPVLAIVAGFALAGWGLG